MSERATTHLTLLGTGDAMGVPRVYCDCEVCTEARASGRNRRLRASLHIDDPGSGHTLIDCGPDWGRQMAAAGLRTVDRILVTHAHFDHIGGLVEWADACRWLGRAGQCYAPARTIAQIRGQFPWLDRHLELVPCDDGLVLGDWDVRCWLVNHGKNGISHAFRFDRQDGFSWAYCSDAIGLTPGQLEPLRGLDLLVLGTSFYKEPFPLATRSVYDVCEALELLKELVPKRTVFTHLSHDLDLCRDYGLPAHASFGESGLCIEV
ncbi:MBL fold metallo-hydrolase [Paenibacillus sp. IB182496]|uniref:MBL fold metallo-hydrolase n=1 Tax=Paenibacillus sabuli TaxID=2772509 RepID=A0A927GTT3_9BACL|nr:MBL fold metallo-hydrolase [Paenibacillus sabuli]MBD2847953.1 MBL fold metallo-hydrolase [Paenibacillus sabuli]